MRRTAGLPEAPVPLRVTTCGLAGSESATLSEAVRVPAAAGVKVTLTVQECDPAKLVPQVFVCVKSEAFVPVKVRLLIVIAEVLAFVTVTVCEELGEPTFVEGKVSDTGATLMAAVPVPVKDTVCGVPVALSATLMEALRAPRAVGLNVTVMVQLAPAASEVVQVVVRVKSAEFVPVTVIVEIATLPRPVFFTVIVWVALGLRYTSFPNANDAGVSETVLVPVPVPDNEIT